ncbi:ATP-binding protein [Myxococcota bacterium]|nr:ATP-binding protein [Myxococcota bacterium]
MEPHVSLPISEASDIGEARRVAARLTSSLGFDATDAGRVALVVTEAATNIVKHAGKGELLLGRSAGSPPGIEVLALDRGPGMSDVARCLVDGYSTAGSAGTGLGAITRIAAACDVHSLAGRGTVLLATVLRRNDVARPPPKSGLVVGAVRVAAPGELACGDDWAITERGDRTTLLLADGLGHGPEAARAAEAATRVVRDATTTALSTIFEATHGAITGTRGAAVSAAEISLDLSKLRFAGVGNVAGFVAWASGSRGMVTQNGVLGNGTYRPVRELEYRWTPACTLVMHTDGLSTHTNVGDHPGLLTRHPTVVAAVLYRDFRRGRDDATVVVAREVGAR